MELTEKGWENLISRRRIKDYNDRFSDFIAKKLENDISIGDILNASELYDQFVKEERTRWGATYSYNTTIREFNRLLELFFKDFNIYYLRKYEKDGYYYQIIEKPNNNKEMKTYSEEQIKQFKKEYDDLGLILKNSKSDPKNCTSKSSLSKKERSGIYNRRIELKRNITSVGGYEELIALGPEDHKKRSEVAKKGHENRKKEESVVLSDGALSVMSLMQKLTCFQEKWNLVIKHLAEVDKLLTI